MSGNDFPKIGINTEELRAEIERLLAEARDYSALIDFGAVNWGDLGVADIQYRLSMLHPENGPECVVLIEEADPGCFLREWLMEQMDSDKFPSVTMECEW